MNRMDDLISRRAAIDALDKRFDSIPMEQTTEILQLRRDLRHLPSAQPESFEHERKKIAEALSDKMAYMHTCLNERDIILGIVGVERPSENHCNSDCWNEKCACYRYATKTLPSAQPSISCCHENDLISRHEVLRLLDAVPSEEFATKAMLISGVKSLPSAQPDLTKEYAKAVRTWLVHYQVKCAELQGSYTPYDVLGWIVSDWRKENEIW